MTDPITLTAYAANLAADTTARTITGTVSLYETPTDDRRGLIIRDGALDTRQPLDRTKLLRDHNPADPVGYMIAFDPATLVATFYLPEGENGDRALAEARDKLRDGLSIGFTTLEHTWDDGDHLVIHKALVNEVSLCAIPAFIGAGVESVNMSATLTPTTPDKENTDMPTLTADDLDAALSAQAADLDRRVEARLASFTPAAPDAVLGADFASAGEFMLAVANKDAAALDLYNTLNYNNGDSTALAFEGVKTVDGKRVADWISDAIHWVNDRRPTVNLFQRETLPAKGNKLEYLKAGEDTTKVEKQANEGDNLKFGKVTLDTDFATVETFGGYSSASRQTVERSDTPIVSEVHRRLLNAYARATELDVRAKVHKLIADQITAGNALTGSASLTAFDWLDLVVDAADLIDERGYALSGMVVSKDVFKRLLRLETSGGDPLVHVSGTSVNQVGTVDLTGIKGDLASVTFRLLPGAPAGTAAFYDPQAYTVFENSSPTQLADDSIIDLTSAFSVYGYMASTSQHPLALLPISGLSGAPVEGGE
ncbi:HK97 family phage prohead protease [Mycetocola reblochoni]|uniref:HK97 family phage prohead protease n=1 Tax=Mycetocola reblochoni TaxID=331618 RepID=UPI003F98B475